MASPTISVSCHQPEPMLSTSTSAMNTPVATPSVTSATRRNRWP